MLAALLAMGAQPQEMNALKTKVENLLRSSRGVFAVAFEDLQTGARILINEKQQFHAASMMKVPVMIEVYRQAEQGHFNLDDSVRVKNEFRSIVDGSTYGLSLSDDSDESMYTLIGKKATIRHMVEQMITVSSNLATNILIDLVDAKEVTRTMRSLGANDIQVLRGVEDTKAFEAGLNNTTTAEDLLFILKAIAQGKAVSQKASREMIAILQAQQFRDKIPALLPSDVRVAHKTGSITGVEHDGGIVFLPDGRSYVLVVLSKGLTSAEEGKKTIAGISKTIYDFMMEGH